MAVLAFSFWIQFIWQKIVKLQSTDEVNFQLFNILSFSAISFSLIRKETCFLVMTGLWHFSGNLARAGIDKNIFIQVQAVEKAY